MAERERRFIAGEVRAVPAGQSRVIRGHAALFNVDYQPCGKGSFVERIAPGAFTETLRSADSDVCALWNHDSMYVIGRTTSGTARVIEDASGLAYEADAPDTQWARDLIVSMDRRDIRQSSFCFCVESPQDEEWRVENGILIRTIHRVSLFDVGPVTFPANPRADASARSMEEAARCRLEAEASRAQALARFEMFKKRFSVRARRSREALCQG